MFHYCFLPTDVVGVKIKIVTLRGCRLRSVELYRLVLRKCRYYLRG